MRLQDMPPAGALYAGSSTAPLDWLAPVYSVHHPSGDFQKSSSGYFSDYGNCRWSPGLNCGRATDEAGSNSLQVRWSTGTTEGGSSGGGLFTRLNGKDYLVGQLSGGAASCSSRSSPDYFGRFDVAYNTALVKWLGAMSSTVRVPVYRLYNNKTGTHFYTVDPAERDRTVTKWHEFTYEGVGFYAYGAPGVANDSVHRFYNNRTGAHFFTISAAERNDVRSRYPWYSYEGVSWQANVSPGNGSVPMYRFYNSKTATHFYTINQAERDQVIARYPEYSYEGIGYYGWTAQQ